MISVITVSRDEKKVAALDESLNQTFGASGDEREIGFELISMNGEKFDLFTGYNEGAKAAAFDVLVFTHDDVRLWSNTLPFQRVLALVRKPMTGVIGVAGARSMPAEGCWWRQDHNDLRGAVYHPDPNVFGAHLNVWPFGAAQYGPVAVCDGVFLMTSRAAFERLGGFAADAYQGFHFYDVDLTLRASLAGMRNYVCPVPLFHGSIGVPNENWQVNKSIFLGRFGARLPHRVDG